MWVRRMQQTASCQTPQRCQVGGHEGVGRAKAADSGQKASALPSCARAAVIGSAGATHSSRQPACIVLLNRAEELNRAYANHEIIGDYLTACLAWLEAGGKLPLDRLAQQFAAVALPSERLRDLAPQRLHMLPMRVRKAAAGQRR